jgi:hypothetical protein
VRVYVGVRSNHAGSANSEQGQGNSPKRARLRRDVDFTERQSRNCHSERRRKQPSGQGAGDERDRKRDGIKSEMNNLNVVGGSSHPPTAPGIHQSGFTGTKTISLIRGTNLPIRITDEINTKTAKVNDSFHGTLASSIRENGFVLLPTGTPVLG